MIFTRRTRRHLAWIAMVALLFAQMAVAAYACPFITSSNGEAAMPADCASAAAHAEQPNLCKAHAEAPSQLKADNTASAITVPTTVAIALVPVGTSDSSNVSRSDSYSLARLAPDGSPPLYVSHQVFRK